MLIEKIWGVAVLATCALLLLRLVLGDARRSWLDAHLLRGWLALNRAALAFGRALRRAWQAPGRWRRARAAEAAAAVLAAAAIARARERAANRDNVERDGNVYKPKSFRKPPHDKLH